MGPVVGINCGGHAGLVSAAGSADSHLLGVSIGHAGHVELPRHDVLLAEGLPAETYLDTGDQARSRMVAYLSDCHRADSRRAA